MDLIQGFQEIVGPQNVLTDPNDQAGYLVDWTNRNTCVLFGDGAGAVILGIDEADNGPDFLVASDLHTDGTLCNLLKLPAGGSRMPTSEETVAEKNYLHN